MFAQFIGAILAVINMIHTFTLHSIHVCYGCVRTFYCRSIYMQESSICTCIGLYKMYSFCITGTAPCRQIM